LPRERVAEAARLLVQALHDVMSLANEDAGSRA
jgi:hypothetical protein